MIQLDLVGGPSEGTSFRTDEPSFVIGRGRTNRIILLDAKVSARHAQIECRGGQYLLRDLNSRNGTFVNGRTVHEAVLGVGDEVRLGQSVLRVAAVSISPTSPAGRVSISDGDTTAPPAVQIRLGRKRSPPVFPQAPEQANLPVLVDAYRNLLAMYKVAGIIRSNADLNKLLDEVLDQVFRNFRADRAAILLFDDETGELVPRAFRTAAQVPGADEMNISRTIVNEVIGRQEAILTGDATVDERFKPAASVVQQHIRSAMCAPVGSENRVLGILYVDCRSEAGTFTKGDLEMLVAIGNEAGIAVENRILRDANIKAERLAAVGQTVAGLSHYIKNILSCMQAGSEIITRALGDGNLPSARKGWGIVHRNERKIAELALDMLNYSAQREPVKRLCDLNGIIEDIVETVQPAADDAKARIDLRLDRSLPEVPVDPTGIQRCLLNLLTNALDAVVGREGAVITISTGREAHSAVLRVADNGCGIDWDNQPRIFEVFFTTKGERGTGLGLAVVRKIVHEHAGEIAMTSTPGQGTEFKISLPIAPTQTALRPAT